MLFQKGHKINLGKNNRFGYKHSEETKKKISISNKGKIAWNKGISCSEETKRKISNTNKRNGIEPKIKFVGYKENHPNWKGGKPKCIDCGKQLVSYSAKRCFRCMHKGKLAYNWKGTTKIQRVIRYSIEMNLWRKTIFERDDYICQKTDIKGGKLHPHHIKNFAKIIEENNIKTFEQALKCKELWDVNNGITLSKQAHNKFHKIYGYKNNSKKQIKEFLTI